MNEELKAKNKNTLVIQGKKPPSFILSSDEISDLDQFCKDLEIEDISFKAWSHSHRNLDIYHPVFISQTEAKQGGKKILKFIRIITKMKQNKLFSTKEEMNLEFCWASNVLHDHKIIFEGRGDCYKEKTGNLFCQIKIKSR